VITVADCERVQTEWFRYRATNLGGAVWEDGPLTWTDGPDGRNLMFPPALTDATLLRGLLRAGTRPVGAWLGLDDEGRFAGHAWSFVSSSGLAGIFDMAVWPPFRRRGLGTALVKAVSVASGAQRAILNATREGKLLYETCGFRQIGEGITYWRH
jgi:GNAT superfamily N-acetyltransferase